MSVLTEEGEEQAQEVTKALERHLKEKEELVFIISPLQRSWQTIKPTLITLF
jgi:broad specificity phosphatase PhoE